MGRSGSRYVCQDCGLESPKWFGRCPQCESWNSLVEERVHAKGSVGAKLAGRTGAGPGGGRGMTAAGLEGGPVKTRGSLERSAGLPVPVTEVSPDGYERLPCGLPELDRVLGGGLIPGSVVLVGGDPGIGKSTLLLQAAYSLATREIKVLYVSAEESAAQIRHRAARLGALSPNLLVSSQGEMESVLESAIQADPKVVVVDSIQTIYDAEMESPPGSVGQVRECALRLTRMAKDSGRALFLIGHVTKEGSVAGPRTLEHLVDCVLYLEGEGHQVFRILRAAKNRFGTTNEMGVFEMGNEGLAGVSNPSAVLLAHRPSGVPGSAVVAALEGTRPLLAEIQALVTDAGFGTPRRLVTGFDHRRASMIVAVLEKRIGLQLQGRDIYVNTAGGIRLAEPANDLGCALAIASSFRNLALPPELAAVGEVGLTGEIRPVSRLDARLTEAARHGFSRCLAPRSASSPAAAVGVWGGPDEGTIEVLPVGSLAEALDLCF